MRARRLESVATAAIPCLDSTGQSFSSELPDSGSRTLGAVDRALLDQTLAAAGEPAYRASQVWEWVARGARSYAEMTNLPAALRERLAAAVPLSTLGLAGGGASPTTAPSRPCSTPPTGGRSRRC